MEDREMLQVILQKVTGMETDISGLKDDMTGLKTDVAGLKDDVAGLKTDVAGLKTDVAELRSDVDGLKSDMHEVKADVAGLKTEMAEVKERVTNIEIIQETVTNRNIQLLMECQRGINDKFRRLDHLEANEESLDIRTTALEEVTRTHTAAIRELRIAK